MISLTTSNYGTGLLLYEVSALSAPEYRSANLNSTTVFCIKLFRPPAAPSLRYYGSYAQNRIRLWWDVPVTLSETSWYCRVVLLLNVLLPLGIGGIVLRDDKIIGTYILHYLKTLL